MRVLTVPILEGIDGEEEDKMSTTTDSLETSNDDKQSNTSISNDKNQNDINESNNTKNEFYLNSNDVNKMNNENENNDENENESENVDNMNKEILSKLKPFSSNPSNPSNPSLTISNDTADRTYHESASYSIILGGTTSESPTLQNNILFKDKYSLENLNEDKDKIDNNLDLTNKCTDKERTESNPRDELIMSFATAILKSGGTRSTDSLNDNKSIIDYQVTSSSECSRRNSQVHSASGNYHNF